MNSLLLVIDLQKAFINENTQHIVGKIEKLLEDNKYENVVFTKFVNSFDNILYRESIYRDCLDDESKKIVVDTRGHKVIEKTLYSSLNDELKKYISENNIDKIFICGIDTECCVLSTVYDMFEKEYNIYVLKDYCACCDGLNSHNHVINILKRNIGEHRVL